MDHSSNLVRIGKIGRAHGIRGELRLFTDNPESNTLAHCETLILAPPSRAQKRARTTVTGKGSGVARTLLSARPSNRFWIVKLSGVSDRSAAEALTGSVCYVDRSALPEIEDDELYYHDLLGLRVVDAKGTPLGTVTDLFDNGAHDVLEYAPHCPTPNSDSKAPASAPQLVPFVDAFVIEVDLDAGIITLDAPEYE